jgi:hypothetical protein
MAFEHQEWTVTQIDLREWEYHDGNRVRAILQHRPQNKGRPWLVHRINSAGQGTGCDQFRSRGVADDFITNGKIFR